MHWDVFGGVTFFGQQLPQMATMCDREMSKDCHSQTQECSSDPLTKTRKSSGAPSKL